MKNKLQSKIEINNKKMKKHIIFCSLFVLSTLATVGQKTEHKVLLYKTKQIEKDGFVSKVEIAEETWTTEETIINLLKHTTYLCVKIDSGDEGPLKTIKFTCTNSSFSKGYIESDYLIEEEKQEIDYMELYDPEGSRYIVVLDDDKNPKLIKALDTLLNDVAANCIDNGETEWSKGSF